MFFRKMFVLSSKELNGDAHAIPSGHDDRGAPAACGLRHSGGRAGGRCRPPSAAQLRSSHPVRRRDPAGQDPCRPQRGGRPVSDLAAPARSLAAYGDTRAQTVGALTGIAGTLKGLGLTLGDVVNMTVFLVGDPAKNGRMDFDGFMQGYRQFFGGPDQPRLPTRSTVQVGGLANPGWLMEIEVTAVRP